MADGKPIFYDEQRRRWKRTRRVLEISGALFAFIVVVFVVNILRKPDLPGLLLPVTHPLLRGIRENKLVKLPVLRHGRKKRVAALGQQPNNYDPLRAAFYENGDPAGFAALQQHYKDLDVLIPEGLKSISPDGRLDVDLDPKIPDWMHTSGIEIPLMPLLQNSDGVTWHIKELSELLAHPAARAALIASVVHYEVTQHDAGVVVDFEQVADESQDNFVKFSRELAAALHAQNLKLMVALPAADWAYDYKSIAEASDAIILMNYDQHWLTSAPGPIAAQDWYTTNLNKILELVPRQKLVMGIANYAYDWPVKSKANPHPTGTALSYQEAVVRAVESEADVTFDSKSLNPHYSYVDEDNVLHEVWMLDGVTAYNELRAAEQLGVRGTVVWRLGSEDPSMWFIWDATHPTAADRNKLIDLPPGYDLILEGRGDIWRITNTPESGKRSFDYDADSDTFDDESFESYPMSWRIDQIGAAPHKLALTFDDGPDPEWTPKILDILKAKHAPATFFAIGLNADNDPALIRREYAEGHEIGNHTYTHPDFEASSKAQIQFELNLTQRLIEATLGVKTILFRPPYGIDHQPETASEISLLPIPQAMGYLIIGARIDPHDWGEVGDRPPPPTADIVKSVIDQAQQQLRAGGNIVLMHDGGGNRSHTVEALPQIIDALREQGFEFVTVSDLLGQSRAEVMPPLSQKEWIFARSDWFIFELAHWFRTAITFIFIAGILLVSGRALIIGLLALVEKLRPAPQDHPEYQPLVSVLIPAYNEESVILSTVRSALASDYPNVEILVVDDGSSDNTSELVTRDFGDDPRVRLITQPNRGKPAALNHGLTVAAGEIAVTIDADTCVNRDAVRKLVRNFADPAVAAVAGNVKVMNRNRWLTRWQALEYITSQNLEKRAFDLLNCIPVVPGAVGAWRTEVIRQCGGFSRDTVAEDTDLTLTIRRQGWKILYDEDAIGYTEVPETVEALIRQRFRWTFGTIQAVWKHRDVLGRKKYGSLGWVALPNIFLFQILLPLVSPVIDLLFLLSLLLWGLAQLHVTHVPQLWTAQDVERSLIFFAVFMVIDLITCMIAFALERHEDWTLLAPLLIQRFYYRQMMYVVLFRALKEAVSGRPVGWRGVEPQLPPPVVQTQSEVRVP
jgi:cellulose synthase/poly-beta-1,6-N-acetylglucosamine synthase-like glycosyltransferase/spore germination protein YaaH/peptidoglycan/xylan/chitin deacetylase (PgdA/CDA1 family)